MRNCLSPSPNIKSISYFNRMDNCDCDCHYDDGCNDDLLALSARENNCFSPSPMRTNIKADFHNDDIKNAGCLCLCENVCNCPCHCISCVCCPCVKERQEPDTNDYYRNLYLEIKSELELEKKRNERMKYNKKINENNMENSKKEKEILLNEIEQLKDKLGETMNKLKEQTEKNMARDDELYTFKEEEIPKKDEVNKQINHLNNQLNNLSKEKIELK